MRPRFARSAAISLAVGVALSAIGASIAERA